MPKLPPQFPDFDRLFAVNVRSPFFLIQQTLPILRNGSSIVFVSSLGARAVVGTLAAYAATKGAIDTLVKHFAAALGPRGIRVNAVAPGIVDTDMSNFTKTDAGHRYALNIQALQRLARPEDIAPVVAFLASAMPAGSPPTPFEWTVVQSFERNAKT
jgi:3-oxoacyl-[acyl-carrier protein] reductase